MECLALEPEPSSPPDYIFSLSTAAASKRMLRLSCCSWQHHAYITCGLVQVWPSVLCLPFCATGAREVCQWQTTIIRFRILFGHLHLDDGGRMEGGQADMLVLGFPDHFLELGVS